MARLLNYSRVLCQYTDSNNVDILYKKAYCRCEVDGDYVLFFAQDLETNRHRQQYRVHYADWGDPVGASAADIKAAIDLIIDSYTGVFYGSYYDTTTQTNAGATSENIIGLNSTNINQGISLVSGNQIKVPANGIYLINYTLHYEKTSGPQTVVQLWLKKNGSNVANTASEFEIHHNNGTYLASGAYMIQLNKGQYIQMAWHSPDTTVRLITKAAGTSPTRPAVPSAIISAHYIAG